MVTLLVGEITDAGVAVWSGSGGVLGLEDGCPFVGLTWDGEGATVAVDF